MWAVFALILGALVFYLFERAAMEMTSLGIICVLLIFFHFFPVVGADGAHSVVRTGAGLGPTAPRALALRGYAPSCQPGNGDYSLHAAVDDRAAHPEAPPRSTKHYHFQKFHRLYHLRV